MKSLKDLLGLLLIAAIIIFGYACSSDDDNAGNQNESLAKGKYGLVINEGGFQQGNASLGLFDKDTREYNPNFFQTISGSPLGDIFQSIHFRNETAYLVVNNSSTIEILNLNPLEHLGSISNLPSPRYMTTRDGFGYVSNLFGNVISVVGLEEMRVISTMDFPGWSEEMIWLKNDLLVSCPSCPGLYLIDLEAQMIIDSVATGPNSSFLRKLPNGNILSFSTGSFDGEILPSLLLLDEELNKLDRREIAPMGFIGAFELDESQSRFLYFDGDLMFIEVNDDHLSTPQTLFNVDELTSAYGLSLNSNGQIFITNARDFNSIGEIIVYDKDGMLLDRFEAGVVPSAVVEY